jgi:hypothetical protein
MVLAVQLQHYRNLIFKFLGSTYLLRNEFIAAYLYIADHIMLFFCDVELGFKDFWIFGLGPFHFLFFVCQKPF